LYTYIDNQQCHTYVTRGSEHVKVKMGKCL